MDSITRLWLSIRTPNELLVINIVMNPLTWPRYYFIKTFGILSLTNTRTYQQINFIGLSKYYKGSNANNYKISIWAFVRVFNIILAVYVKGQPDKGCSSASQVPQRLVPVNSVYVVQSKWYM